MSFNDSPLGSPSDGSSWTEAIARMLQSTPVRILELLGQGGAGVVYKAIDETRHQTIALKVIPPKVAQQPKYKEDFEARAKILIGLEHPYIVPILEFTKQAGYIFISMPYLGGGNLRQRLFSGGMTWQDCGRMTGQIAQALTFAHQLGLVHRDLKPSNILFDDNDNAWLSDFDFALITGGQTLFEESGPFGTPAYMSPEQCLGKIG